MTAMPEVFLRAEIFISVRVSSSCPPPKPPWPPIWTAAGIIAEGIVYDRMTEIVSPELPAFSFAPKAIPMRIIGGMALVMFQSVTHSFWFVS